MEDVHLNEFLRRLNKERPEKSYLSRLIFEREDDDMNIGSGTWLLLSLEEDTARFMREGGRHPVTWSLSHLAGSIIIDDIVPVGFGGLVRPPPLKVLLGAACSYSGAANIRSRRRVYTR